MLVYVKQINAFKPVQILAYAESIYELSRFIERGNLKVYRPRAVLTSAGTLHEYMRRKIEEVFNAPVFNRYGSREVGDIACECDHHKGLHVSPLTHYIEILRQDGSMAQTGEQGEIVITLLTNYAMPLIRYRIGDMGVWAEKPCTCGRSWPLLREVTGRVTDNFVTSEGKLLYGGFFRQLLFSQEWIKKYQIIQEDFNHIHIFIVLHKQNGTTPEFYSEKMKEITQRICLVMGQDCRVKFDFVDDIVSSPSGKYRHTVSKVARKE
jgi:phenylacetate-CoA ligase